MRSILHFDNSSLMVENKDGVSEIFEWKTAVEVFAYKDDVVAYDIICIGFRTNEAGDYFWVDEECEGYKEMVSFLPAVFSGIRTDWFSEVAFPAFKPCVTSLWGEDKIQEIWKDEQDVAR